MSKIRSLVQHIQGKEGTLNFFGLILYTHEHANVIKVLRDEDYWSALNEKSGPKFTVFSVRPTPNLKERLGETAETITTIRQLSSFTVAQVMSIIPTALILDNKNFLNEVGIEGVQKLPLLTCFTYVEDRIMRLDLELNDSSEASAYYSMKNAIELVMKGLEKITPENEKNGEGIYSAVSLAINSNNQWKFVKRVTDFAAWANQFRP